MTPLPRLEHYRIQLYSTQYSCFTPSPTDNMPVESTLPQIDIPNVGIWDFLFERKDLDFPEDKGKQTE